MSIEELASFISKTGHLIIPKKKMVKEEPVILTEEDKKAFRNIEDIYVEGEMSLPPYQIYTPEDYKDGPEGFIKWVEENVCIPIYPEGSDISVWCAVNELPSTPNPETGRSYVDFWNAQKKVARNCLRMSEGRFIYKLIILCWMRGEGKSLFACLIQLWKFFNWTRQNIVLGANSKEQIQFVHYDIMRDIILNSPKLLLIVGKKNVQEKLIRIRDDKNNPVCIIRAISSFSGIVSNITGYTFSEIFDMKNPKFFTQLDGSIRNIPNALGVIDSTVSSKDHILYGLFTSFVKKKVKSLYFSYRASRNGDHRDFWNPMMSQNQLNDYQAKFLPADFERYFKNTWDSGSQKIFTPAIVDSLSYVGSDNKIGNFEEMCALLIKRQQLIARRDNFIAYSVDEDRQGEMGALTVVQGEIEAITKRMVPVENYYKLTDGFNASMATMDDLQRMGDLFDTDWAIMAGLDRADPMKTSVGGARTMFVCVAKGLPGSRTHYQPFDEQGQKQVPNYLYLLLHVADIENDSLESCKEVVLACDEEYDGIDTLCGERWGIWDIVSWCDEHNIKFEVVYPNYDKQKAAFSELYLATKRGRVKAPIVYILGSKEPDILREEMRIFYHDPDKKWFGSPEKFDKDGVQDDSMFSLAWCMYGGRDLNADSFRARKKKMWFGTLIQERTLASY